MSEPEGPPAPDSDPGDSGGGEPSTDEMIYTPTDLGDYEIREGEYGPLDTGEEPGRSSRDDE